MKWRPQLRAILLIVNLVILLLPLAGIWILRLYESELIRQTESELTAQGAIIAATYRDAWLRAQRETGGKQVRIGQERPAYGNPVPPQWRDQWDPRVSLRPIQPALDIAQDLVYGPAPEGEQPAIAPDQRAVRAGELVLPILSTAKGITLAGIRVMDYRGTVVASTGADLSLSLAGRIEVQRALRGEYYSLLRKRGDEPTSRPLASISRDTEVRVFVAMPVVHQDRVVGAVALSRTPLSIIKAVYLSRHYFIGGALVLLAVVLLVSLFTSLTISRPVAALIRQAEGVSKGELSAVEPLKRPGTREVALLSEALAGMAVTLQKKADYIRTFASNVSHAFKTPLTSIRGTVELLQDHLGDMNATDKDRFLHILGEDTDRLQRLVTKLLLLARAESLRPADESTSLPDVLASVVQRYRETGHDVSLDCSRAANSVRIGKEALESIISSLLDNSIQHGGDGVKVFITTGRASTPDSESVVIRYHDTGPGIPTDKTEAVFRPFFTTAGDKGGTGLGLSIVRALLAAHDGTIVLEPATSGAAFSISLPR